jgi:hypothetical protein
MRGGVFLFRLRGLLLIAMLAGAQEGWVSGYPGGAGSSFSACAACSTLIPGPAKRSFSAPLVHRHLARRRASVRAVHASAAVCAPVLSHLPTFSCPARFAQPPCHTHSSLSRTRARTSVKWPRKPSAEKPCKRWSSRVSWSSTGPSRAKMQRKHSRAAR